VVDEDPPITRRFWWKIVRGIPPVAHVA
jgi:hypothetical protein